MLKSVYYFEISYENEKSMYRLKKNVKTEYCKLQTFDLFSLNVYLDNLKYILEGVVLRF